MFACSVDMSGKVTDSSCVRPYFDSDVKLEGTVLNEKI